MSKNKKRMVVLIILIALITLGIGIFLLFHKEKGKQANTEKEITIKDSITLEVNSPLINIQDLFYEEIMEDYTIKYYLNEEEISFSNAYYDVGEYGIIVTINHQEYKSKLIINDVTKPELELKEVTIHEDETYDVEDFIQSCTDNSGKECILELESEEIYSKEGSYDITIIARDSSNNIAKATTKLIIHTKDNNQPNTTVNSSGYVETKKEVTTSKEDFKYGIKIIKTITTTYDVYSDGSIKNKKSNTATSYDYSSHSATANDLLPEAIINRNTYAKEVQEVLNYTNAYRAEVGLSPLVIDEDLTKVAMVRAMEMGYGNTLDHIRPNGDFCFSVADELGFGDFWGENLAWGQSSAQGATTWWRNSPGHYLNMTMSSYTKLGVGVIKYNGRYLWVQVFA